MVISMLKIRRPLGRLIFNMGIAIPGKTVFLIETAPCWQPVLHCVIVNHRCDSFIITQMWQLIILLRSFETTSADLWNYQLKIQDVVAYQSFWVSFPWDPRGFYFYWLDWFQINNIPLIISTAKPGTFIIINNESFQEWVFPLWW